MVNLHEEPIGNKIDWIAVLVVEICLKPHFSPIFRQNEIFEPSPLHLPLFNKKTTRSGVNLHEKSIGNKIDGIGGLVVEIWPKT